MGFFQFGGGGGGTPTYPLLADDGTVTDPSYSFTNDTTSGMWRDGTAVSPTGTSMKLDIG